MQTNSNTTQNTKSQTIMQISNQQQALEHLRNEMLIEIENLHNAIFRDFTTINIIQNTLTFADDESAMLSIALTSNAIDYNDDDSINAECDEPDYICNQIKNFLKDYLNQFPIVKSITETETYTSHMLYANCYEDQICTFIQFVHTDSSLYITLIDYPQ